MNNDDQSLAILADISGRRAVVQKAPDGWRFVCWEHEQPAEIDIDRLPKIDREAVQLDEQRAIGGVGG